VKSIGKRGRQKEVFGRGGGVGGLGGWHVPVTYVLVLAQGHVILVNDGGEPGVGRSGGKANWKTVRRPQPSNFI